MFSAISTSFYVDIFSFLSFFEQNDSLVTISIIQKHSNMSSTLFYHQYMFSIWSSHQFIILWCLFLVPLASLCEMIPREPLPSSESMQICSPLQFAINKHFAMFCRIYFCPSSHQRINSSPHTSKPHIQLSGHMSSSDFLLYFCFSTFVCRYFNFCYYPFSCAILPSWNFLQDLAFGSSSFGLTPRRAHYPIQCQTSNRPQSTWATSASQYHVHAQVFKFVWRKNKKR